MEVSYRLTREDYIAYYSFVWEQHKSNPRFVLNRIYKTGILWLARILLGLAIALSCMILVFGIRGLFRMYVLRGPQHIGNAEWDLAMVVTCIVMPLFFIPFLTYLILRKRKTREQAIRSWAKKWVDWNEKSGVIRLDGCKNVSIDDTGIIETDRYEMESNGVRIKSHVRTTIEWSKVQKINLLERHAFIDIGEAGFWLLPQSAFSGEAEFSEFVAAVKRFKDGLASDEQMETGITEKPLVDQSIKETD